MKKLTLALLIAAAALIGVGATAQAYPVDSTPIDSPTTVVTETDTPDTAAPSTDVATDDGETNPTVVATNDGETDSTVVGGLPSTGSSGLSTTAGIAIGLLIVGIGLVVVAVVRRRRGPVTA